jgi:hypothetical protein
MQVRVEYHDGLLEFDAPPDRLVAAFAPPPAPEGDPRERIRRALEEPIDYPPLRQVVVPGDRVAIPLDLTLPDASLVLATVAEILAEVGVESIAALVDGRDRGRPGVACPPGVELVVHDPTDRESLAYLASTAEGRRIYLHRRLADADCVVPIGRIGPDDALGLRGPWSVVDPGLSDAPPARAPLLTWTADLAAEIRLEEAMEVSWLLGSQLVLGGVPGNSGLGDVLCGQPRTVRDRGAERVREAWGLRLDDRVDLVIAGLGGPGRPANADDFLDGFRHALRVVRRGGKVVLLTRLDLATLTEAARSELIPRGDWEKALAWADVYLASSAPGDDVDELGMIPLDRPEQAARLAAMAPSFAAMGQADRIRATATDEANVR